MRKRTTKISYIKKPFAKRSRVSFPFALAALACAAVSLGISIHHQGNGGVNVAAWALSSMLLAAVGLWYGVTSMVEKEMNYLLAKISIGLCGVLLVFWVCLLIAGLAG